jgi:hypothetical protein
MASTSQWLDWLLQHYTFRLQKSLLLINYNEKHERTRSAELCRHLTFEGLTHPIP